MARGDHFSEGEAVLTHSLLAAACEMRRPDRRTVDLSGLNGSHLGPGLDKLMPGAAHFPGPELQGPRSKIGPRGKCVPTCPLE
jgi:hypothetical protein